MGKSTLRNKKGLTEDEFLSAYDPSKYDRPSVTVDMLIFSLAGSAKKCEQSSEKVICNY